jgi:hypothetical protein
MQTNVPMVMMALFLGALAAGLFYFVVRMNETSYLLTDGVRYTLQVIDKPRYEKYLQGMIYAAFFLLAGLLFLLVILLPDKRSSSAAPQYAPPPQPRRRPVAAPLAAVQPAPAATVAPAPPPPPAAEIRVAPEPPPVAEETIAAPPIVDVISAEPAPKAKPKPKPSVEEELAATPSEDLPIIDVPDTRPEDTGEDDVVYGTGRVTDDSIWDFVLSYPDSAVKFLYRKTLENKPLTPTEEDIYRKWEMRGLSRSKVRGLVLEIMRWKSLPEDFPHNIWRALRDQIFDMKTK